MKISPLMQRVLDALVTHPLGLSDAQLTQMTGSASRASIKVTIHKLRTHGFLIHSPAHENPYTSAARRAEHLYTYKGFAGAYDGNAYVHECGVPST